MSSIQGVPASRRELAGVWSAAALVAALGTAICFDAPPGINWGLWTLAACVATAVILRRVRGTVGREVALLLALACALAFGAAITANPIFQLSILIGTAVLLAVALRLTWDLRAVDLDAREIVASPFVAAAQVAGETCRRAAQAAELACAERPTPAVRGAAIALPVVGVLALLLSSADPLLASWRDGLAEALGQWTIVPRLIFFGVLGALVLGAYGIVVRPAPTPQRADAPAMMPRLRLGDTERLIVLGAMSALFALFLLLQLSYLFGNAPAVRGSGISFAEYAHRGFGELTVAASLATALVLALDRCAERGPRDGTVRLVAIALVVLVQLLLNSAFRRLNLYESAYGFTTARLYAQVYMVVVSLGLVLLAHEVWGTIDVRRLTRRTALLGVAVLLTLTYWNHEGWIAKKNIERYRETGKLDAVYLVNELSVDAVPTITAALSTLPSQCSEALRSQLFARHHTRPSRQSPWYAWNLRRARAIAALQSAALRDEGPWVRSAGCLR